MPNQEIDSPADDEAAPPTAAFFDVDNTLLHGSSLFMFGRGALKERVITFRQLWQFAYKQFRFKRVGENAKHLASFQARALQIIAGRPVDDLEKWIVPICAKYVTPRIWPDALILLGQQKAAGREVWLVTATPIQIARELARAVGATGALGTIPEQQDGVFTGRIVGSILHGEQKSARVLALVSERGYDLSGSSAYSDSVNDITLLDAVGHPVATNPDEKLEEYATDHGWPVIRFPRGRSRWHRRRDDGGRGGAGEHGANDSREHPESTR